MPPAEGASSPAVGGPAGSGTRVLSGSSGRQRIDQAKARLLLVGFVFGLCFLTIMGKLVATSFVPLDPKLVRQMARAETAGTEEMTIADIIRRTTPRDDERVPTLSLPRRDIVDRNGILLATSLATRSLYAHPSEVKDPAGTAAMLAETLHLDGNLLKRRFALGSKFIWIKRNLTPKEQLEINGRGVAGLYFQDESTRVYPQGSLLAHLIGFVDIDGQGIAGVEKSLNPQLLETDDAGAAVTAPEPVSLSIDVRVQHILTEHLQRAMSEFSAIGAAGAVVHIPDGEVVAMASLPTFDPHHPGRSDPVALFNRMTMGTYEMGSTFKTFTAAMALDAGTVSMQGGYDTAQPIKYGGWTITDSHPENRFLTVPEIYLYSSNIGAAKMARDVGVTKQRAFFDKLDMFRRVDLELPERALPLVPKPWNEINLLTISYGHGISVTPLHLVQGILAMINGGTLDHLTLLKGGDAGRAHGPRVISAETSEHVRRLMRTVVQYGTGKKADVAGYFVGGKTGTAEKVQKGGGYAEKAKMASFIGAFPMNDPEYLILVMIDEPQPTRKTYGFATGGWVAAPAAGEIIAQMGTLLGMAPSHELPAPDEIDLKMAALKDKQKLAEAIRQRKLAERQAGGMHVAKW